MLSMDFALFFTAFEVFAGIAFVATLYLSRW